jgi:hypothetical protein
MGREKECVQQRLDTEQEMHETAVADEAESKANGQQDEVVMLTLTHCRLSIDPRSGPVCESHCPTNVALRHRDLVPSQHEQSAEDTAGLDGND